MNTVFAAMLGGWEIILILAVVLILFGAKKVPELAKGLGQGIKEFKKATREVQDEITNSIEEEPARPVQKRIAPTGTQAQQSPASSPAPASDSPSQPS
jgi:sec-independent protein translocase protein TatA